MKKRLHDKKAGIVILLSLIIISIAEVTLRGVLFKESMFNLSNAGEPFITASQHTDGRRIMMPNGD